MLYRDFCGEEVSALGLGCMRLPVIDGVSANIDDKTAFAVMDMLVEGGVTYVDTAYSYHDGASELFVGRAVKRYGRDRLRVATKMPGHEIRPDFAPEPIFANQLDKTGAGYFDYYLMHNVCEISVDRYMDADLRVLEFLVEQKRRGLIRHLGFSSHGQVATLAKFLEYIDAKAPGEVEFVQLQLNYVDWTLQDGATKYAMARDAGLDVVVMEGLRGGRLARLEGERARELAQVAARCGAAPDAQAELAFRWLLGLERAKVILSGMNSVAQAEDNLRIFAGEAAGGPAPLLPGSLERSALEALGEHFADVSPCTGCRYCTRECPMGLDIPLLLKLRDDGRFGASMTLRMQLDALGPNAGPDACLGCGACASVCPQGIDIPQRLAELVASVEKIAHWADVSAARVAAEAALRK